MSRSEEARKETKLDKDIPEDMLISYTVLFASHYKILNFFRQIQLPKITYQFAFYRICQYILGGESNISLL